PVGDPGYDDLFEISEDCFHGLTLNRSLQREFIPDITGYSDTSVM
ncbi:MAG: hypothetical protein JRJ06_05675, partial [Deltaproteobacteria bacterium]|nr:hypothetical protein [Deltaproteobacteria bacterium]